LASRVEAQQAMPPHVKKAMDAIVGNWIMETEIDGEKQQLDIEIEWAPTSTVLLYHWKGIDLSGEENSGSGMMGWDAGKQAVLEQELDHNGSSLTSVHCITEDGEWTSPGRGTVVVDGEAKYSEAFRIFEIKGKDEWVVKGTKRFMNNKQLPDLVSTFRRKK
jgi:hypothetical protein